MRKVFSIAIFIVALLALILIGTASLSSPEVLDEKVNIATLITTPAQSIKIAGEQNINSLPLVDNQEVYAFDDPGSLIYIYVTIREGNASDNTNHTWAEVNSNVKYFNNRVVNVEVDKAEAIVQFGDENGPVAGEVGYGEIIPNATIQIRGASTSLNPQKSYKIELRDRAGEWRGQTTIALNKHIIDLSRVRNKLAFDLMKDIPNLVSLRTQFFRVYIKDETSDPPSEEYVDYGLFTQIELPNKTFLRNHLLDENGHLYKMTMFEFYRYPESILTADDPDYNQRNFEAVMEIKGNQDHSKLIQMLEDVNNYAIPIDQTFEKYFNGDNYFTWMAFNILVGNLDTQSQNYYLYSPQNSQTWYFLPWDYDGAFMRIFGEDVAFSFGQEWEYGIANYWGSVLANRLLREDYYRDQLTAKIEELKTFLTEARLTAMLEVYRPVVEPFIFSMPDLQYLPAGTDFLDFDYQTIPLEIQINYDLYYQSLEDPMPFYLGKPQYYGDGMRFNWDDAFDFNNEKITYQFMVARDWEFKEMVIRKNISYLTYVDVPYLDPGTYFWRVIATNERGNSQMAFDYYRDAENGQHSGMKYLLIAENGEIFE
jgi:spore coat protein H